MNDIDTSFENDEHSWEMRSIRRTLVITWIYWQQKWKTNELIVKDKNKNKKSFGSGKTLTKKKRGILIDTITHFENGG